MEFCQDYRILNIIYIIKIVITIIKIAVPIILIIFLTVDLISSITSSDNNSLQNVLSKSIKKIVAAIIVFLVPTFVSVVLKIINYDLWENCYDNANKETIDIKKEEYENKQNEQYENIIENIEDSSNTIIDNNNSKDEEITITPGTGSLEIHFIVSGYNDDAILIRTKSKTIMIDGGRIGAKDRVVKYLRELGVTKIDALIGSHLHYNHIQVQSAILENFNVGTIYYGQDIFTCKKDNFCTDEDQEYTLDTINKLNKKPNIIKVGNKFSIGDMSILVVGPSDFKTFDNASYPENYNSLNFILTYGNTKYMFTGDHAHTNAMNLFDKNTLDVDVLKYPHHGNESLNSNYLSILSPKYVITPNYNYSPYPNADNRAKISNIGAKLYEQSTSGNIVLVSDGKNIEVRTNQNASSYAK